MGLTVQIVVDSARPHAQAAWWARTLDWEVEQQDEAFIRRMIAEGYATPEETEEWDGRLVWRAGAAITDPDGGAGSARILFQAVPESKTVKNRVHLDVRITGELDEVRAELVARGARFLHEASQGPHRWYTLADPEGNEFCVSP